MIDQWLEKYTGYERFMPDLERIGKVVDYLELPKPKKIITVAGTNGKGQCSRLLFKELSKKYRVSLLTSPHLVRLNERLVNNDGEITDEKLWKLIQELKPVVEKLNIKLPFFEYVFIVFLMFAKDSDITILEVGLGGRLDAVNYYAADILLLTSISRDHQEFLGNRYDGILKEKLGLLRNNQHFYSSLELNYLRECTQEVLTKFSNVKWSDMFKLNVTKTSDNYYVRNQQLVNYVLEQEFKIKNDIDHNFPGKILSINDNQCYFIPSHNPDGLRKFIQLMQLEKYNFDKVLVFLSKRSIADTKVKVRIILEGCKPIEEISICKFTGYNMMDSEALTSIAKDFNLRLIDDFSEEIKKYKNKNILCIGSNYNYRTLHTTWLNSRPRG
tara:strand:- start:112315 stop:113469 length:1155 start_codon:yes stop_codon:yes gene_type:complete